MDEEQNLSSPIAGGIRGIRRSFSPSIFTGRPVAPQINPSVFTGRPVAPQINPSVFVGRPVPPPPPQPDPQTTSLLNKNSLTLSTVSSQLANIADQVRGLNTSLTVIKDNLQISDELDRNRENEKRRRDAILAEQGLREGKESELEKKVQNALLTPVRRVSTFAKGILSRLTDFLLILAGGWLVDKTLTFLRLSSGDNVDALKEFRNKFLTDLAILGGIGLGLTIGVGKIVSTVGRLTGLALKLAFSGLIAAPFKAAFRFVARNLESFTKLISKQFGNFIKNAPGKILGGVGGAVLGPLSLAPGFFADKITKFIQSVTGKKIITGAVDDVAKAGSKTVAKEGAKGFLRNIPVIGSLIEIGFGVGNFLERRSDRDGDGKPDQTNKEAALGAGGRTLGGLIPFLVGMTLFPEPASSVAGAVGLSILSIFGAISGEYIGDTVSGLRKKQNEGQTNDTRVESEEVSNSDAQVSRVRPTRTRFSSSENVTPINVKKELNIASAVSNMDQSPEISYIPMASANSGVPATAATGGTSSSSPSDSLPTIPTSDFANSSIALTESLFNVVV